MPDPRAGADAELPFATFSNGLSPHSSIKQRLPSLYLLLLWFLPAVYSKTLYYLFLGIEIKMENGSNSNGGQMDQGLPEDMDPIWMSSRTARKIYALGEVEKVSIVCCSSHTSAPTTRTTLCIQDITRLLSLAASSIALLSLPQTDGPEDEDLPKGAERSEKFVDVANEYFERLDVRCMHRSVGRACTLT